MKYPEFVYVTRDANHAWIKIWETDPGIMKLKDGCCYFYLSAATEAFKRINRARAYDGFISSHCNVASEELFGSLPEPDEAWLVNTKTWVWEQVDQTMYLLDPETLEVIE